MSKKEKRVTLIRFDPRRIRRLHRHGAGKAVAAAAALRALYDRTAGGAGTGAAWDCFA